MGFCLERWWWVCREWPQAEVGDVLAGVAAAASWSWSWSWGAEYGASGLCCGRWWAGGGDLASSAWGSAAQLQHGHEHGKHPGQPGEGQLLEKHFELFWFWMSLDKFDFFRPWQVHVNIWCRMLSLPARSRHGTIQCQGTSWQVSIRKDGLHGRARLGASLLMPSRDGFGHSVEHFMALSTRRPLALTDRYADLRADKSPRPVDSNELGSLSDTRTAIVMDASWRPICLQAPTDMTAMAVGDVKPHQSLCLLWGDSLRNIDARPDYDGPKTDVVLNSFTILGKRRGRCWLSSRNSIVVVLWLWLSSTTTQQAARHQRQTDANLHGSHSKHWSPPRYPT